MSEASRRAKKQKMLAELSKMPIVEVACKRAGVSRATFYRWLNEDMDFRDKSAQAINESTEKMSDLAESQLLKNIQDGHMTAIIFWLKYHREVYTDQPGVKRAEAERDYYKRKLENRRDTGHDALREMVEHMRAMADRYTNSDEYKAEQEATMRKASRENTVS